MSSKNFARFRNSFWWDPSGLMLGSEELLSLFEFASLCSKDT